MTKNVVEKAMVFITNFYQSNIAKSTERKNAEHAISVLSNDTFYLQAKVSLLKIALVEIILPNVHRREALE